MLGWSQHHPPTGLLGQPSEEAGHARNSSGRASLHRASGRGAAGFALLFTAAWSAPCVGQALSPSLFAGADTAQSVIQAPMPLLPPAWGHSVRWWEVAAVGGGVGALLADDRHVLHEVREHPTSEAAGLADVLRQAGEVRVYAALSLGTLGVGLLAKDAGITRTGGQLVASGALAAASFGLLKVVTGRSRPISGRVLMRSGRSPWRLVSLGA